MDIQDFGLEHSGCVHQTGLKISDFQVPETLEIHGLKSRLSSGVVSFLAVHILHSGNHHHWILIPSTPSVSITEIIAATSQQNLCVLWIWRGLEVMIGWFIDQGIRGIRECSDLTFSQTS